MPDPTSTESDDFGTISSSSRTNLAQGDHFGCSEAVNRNCFLIWTHILVRLATSQSETVFKRDFRFAVCVYMLFV